MATKKFYSDVEIKSNILLPNESAGTVLVIDGSNNLKSSIVTSTELGHLGGVTSSVQDQMDDAQADATQALSDSAAAQSSADAAQSDATQGLADAASALSAANGAQSDATQALADAAAAQSSADDAQADATQGISDAAAALSAANAAQSDADQGISDAAAALSAANAAGADADQALLDAAAALSAANAAQSDADAAQSAADAAQADATQALADAAAAQAAVDGLPDPIVYKGVYNATTNTPALANADSGKTGFLYQVSVAGSQDFGAGSISFEAGDKVVNNGLTWDKWDMTDSVTSVFGRSGAVSSANGDYTASQVTNVPAGSIAAITVQAAIAELDGDVGAAQADATQALSDAAAAQSDADAAQVDADQAILDAAAAQADADAGIAAAAAAQLAIDDHMADSSGAHAASAISYDNTISGLAATNAKTAIDEVAAAIDNFTVGSVGDINETSFSLANNQVAAANVTGLLFPSASVRAFDALVDIIIDGTADVYESFRLHGVQRASDFQMAVEAVGDNSGITFSITSGGQIQYTSGNTAGFVSGTMKFRAVTTTV